MHYVMVTILFLFLAAFFYSFTVPKDERFDQMLASFIFAGIAFTCLLLGYIILLTV